MCRWAAYSGPSIFMEDMILSPGHSLIDQSQHASEAKTAINGDGFGLAWYGTRDVPGLYRDILPAWADTNLHSLAKQISSSLFLAHVRASTGGGTNRDNCHPFVYKNWSFMHNGQINHFEKLRRCLEQKLSDETYAIRQGSTDSELMFLLAIEFGLERNPKAAFDKMLQFIMAEAEKRDITAVVRFTSCYSDGKSLYAIRYSSDDRPPSLYYSNCTNDKSICLVSEPFDHPDRDWIAVPANSHVKIDAGKINMEPFLQNNFADA